MKTKREVLSVSRMFSKKDGQGSPGVEEAHSVIFGRYFAFYKKFGFIFAWDAVSESFKVRTKILHVKISQ